MTKEYIKRAYKKGYKEGLRKGAEMANAQLQLIFDIAGRIGKKQMNIVIDATSQKVRSAEAPKLTCGFDRAWQGSCKCTDILDNGQCESHQDKCSCGKLATRSCEHTGQFVCGRPLCDECRCKH